MLCCRGVGAQRRRDRLPALTSPVLVFFIGQPRVWHSGYNKRYYSYMAAHNVLIATGLYPPESGGPATYTKLLEERLPRLGWHVAVLPFARVRQWPKVVRHAAYFFICWRMACSADVVYAQDTLSVGLPAAFAARMARKPFVVRVPGDYAWEQARQRFGVSDELDEFQHKRYGWRVELMRRLQRRVVRKGVAVVVPSEYMRELVSGWTNAHKISVIYSSVELPPNFELPVDRPQGFVVLTIARPVPWKGLDAIERVVARERGWIFKHVNNLPHAQAMGWIKTADVYVNNSTYEGLSHLLVEALALGTPVVATHVGGNPEVVGDAGILVPAKDDEALYQAIKQVHDDRVGASDRAAKGLVRAKRFSIDTTITQISDLLSSVCVS